MSYLAQIDFTAFDESNVKWFLLELQNRNFRRVERLTDMDIDPIFREWILGVIEGARMVLEGETEYLAATREAAWAAAQAADAAKYETEDVAALSAAYATESAAYAAYWAMLAISSDDTVDTTKQAVSEAAWETVSVAAFADEPVNTPAANLVAQAERKQLADFVAALLLVCYIGNVAGRD